jgi:hypothetical protein
MVALRYAATSWLECHSLLLPRLRWFLTQQFEEVFRIGRLLGASTRTAVGSAWQEDAGQLNARKVATARGRRWTHAQVRQTINTAGK